MCRLPSRRQTAFIVTDDPSALRLSPGQLGALQGNAIQLLGKRGGALRFFYLRQFFLDGMFNSLGQRFTGQTREPFRQRMGVRILDVQWHVPTSDHLDTSLYPEKTTG